MGNTRYSLRLNTSPARSLTARVQLANPCSEWGRFKTPTRSVTAPLSPVSLRARAAKCATLAPRTKKSRRQSSPQNIGQGDSAKRCTRRCTEWSELASPLEHHLPTSHRSKAGRTRTSQRFILSNGTTEAKGAAPVMTTTEEIK